MATVSKKKTKLAHFPGAEAATDGPTTAVIESSPDPAPKLPAKKGPPKTLTFFQRINGIPFADWGTRAKIRVYRLQPLIDKLRGSDNKFVRIYEEAVTEDKIKVDLGSGRYRLYLSYKGAGEQGEKELDSVEIDILDPAFPPNIPPGEWMNDPRNDSWAWAKPKDAGHPQQYAAQQPQQAPVANPVEVVMQGMKLAGDIRRDLREEMQPAATAAAPVVATPIDPWSAAEKILNMRSDNPMVTILQEELKALRLQMEKRDERMSTMQNELFDAKLNAMKASMQPAAQSKGILEQAKELAEAFGMQPADLLKRFVGGGDGPPVKSRMSGTLEFLSEFVPKVIDSPIVNALASRLAQPPTSTPPPTIINAQPQPNGAQPQADPQQDLFRFVNEHITGPMIEFLNTESSGSDFAAWVYNGFPLAQLEALQNVTHPNLPNLKGAQVIVQLYKSASGGAIWRDHLQAREQQFAQFVDEFCAWKPPEEEPATEVKHEAEGAGDVIDLDKGNDA